MAGGKTVPKSVGLYSMEIDSGTNIRWLTPRPAVRDATRTVPTLIRDVVKPAGSRMAKIKSGIYWVTWADAHAKNSTSLDDLVEPFRANAKAFKKALEDAGAHVKPGTTTRSAKRAYLFHWCWKIGLGKAKASDATALAGVDIEWDHGDAEKSKKGAKEMIDNFGLAIPPNSTNAPALNSNHTPGTAIDMEITWTGTMTIKKKDGTAESVVYMNNVNKNTKLHAVGASYGVKKLTTDAPHWSLDGH